MTSRLSGVFWVVLSVLAGPTSSQAATIVVNSDITVDTVWTRDNEYQLNQPIYVVNQSTLTIEGGTVVRGAPDPIGNQPGALIITRDSKIRVMGTASDPVVMTDLFDDNVGVQPGSPPYDTINNLSEQWGGLVVLGRGLVAVNTANGLDPFQTSDLTQLAPGLGDFGGCGSALGLFPNCDDSDSGEIHYLSIRYAGAQVGNFFLPGLTLAGVGRETEIDHVEIFQPANDGLALIGGAAQLRNVAVLNSAEDAIDIDEGYRGSMQFVYIQQGENASGTSDKAIEIDGGRSPDASQPYGIPVMLNVTAIGLGANDPDTLFASDTALEFKDNAGGGLFNSAFLDFAQAIGCIEGEFSDFDTPASRSVTALAPGQCDGLGPFPFQCSDDLDCLGENETCVDVHRDAASAGMQFELELAGNCFYCFGFADQIPGDPFSADDAGCDNTEHYGTINETDPPLMLFPPNDYIPCSDPPPIRLIDRLPIPGGADPIVRLDPRPVPNGPLEQNVQPTPDNGFFLPAPYRGAFDPDSNWLRSWSTTDRLDYFPVPGITNNLPPVSGIEGDKGPNGSALFFWPPQPGASTYDVLISTEPSFTGGVVIGASGIETPTFEDPVVPPPGGIRYYIARPRDELDLGAWGVAALDGDGDGDGWPDVVDNCPGTINWLQVDTDADRRGDLCDNCPATANNDQADADGDGEGDACEPGPDVPLFGAGFTVPPGVDPTLPGSANPGMGGFAHGIASFGNVVMGAERNAVAATGARLLEEINGNHFILSADQAALDALELLDFFEGVTPVPALYKVPEPAESGCHRLDFGRWSNGPGGTTPGPREGAALVYDPIIGDSFLFGGDADAGSGLSPLGDAWRWDGGQWTQLAPTTSPSSRSEHALTPTLQPGGGLLLFGGADGPAPGDVLNDTWVWDGTDWSPQSPLTSPPPRRGHALATDPKTGLVILFGGIDANGQALGDTWIWDGSDWSPQTLPGPLARGDHSLVSDPVGGGLLLFGGSNGAQRLGDTWNWKDGIWVERSPVVRPGPRAQHSAAPYGAGCGVLLYGGIDAAGVTRDDAWIWDGNDWAAVGAVVPTAARRNGAFALDLQTRQAIAVGGVDAGFAAVALFTPDITAQVRFHRDVPESVGEAVLSANGAMVLQRPVRLTTGEIYNLWTVAMLESDVAALSADDTVLHVRRALPRIPQNADNREAIGADLAAGAPYCGGMGCSGAGTPAAVFDVGWVAGDPAPPPGVTAIGAHVDLDGRTTVRDGLLPSGPPAPLGLCATGEFCLTDADCGVGGVCGSCAEDLLTCTTCAFTNHATHVAGTFAGSGAGEPASAGMAPGIPAITSYDAESSALELVCKMADASTTFDVRVSNHSYKSTGFPIGLYNIASAAIDERMRVDPGLIPFWGAGNDQKDRAKFLFGPPRPEIFSTTCATPPPLVTLPAVPTPPDDVLDRFYTLPYGKGQIAKNAIVVGAVNSGTAGVGRGRMTTFSSWGPTQDGPYQARLGCPWCGEQRPRHRAALRRLLRLQRSRLPADGSGVRSR